MAMTLRGHDGTMRRSKVLILFLLAALVVTAVTA
jgi:hypothetical protein